MMKFPTMPVKAFVAVAALTLLTAASPAPAPAPTPAIADAVYEVDNCPDYVRDEADDRRIKLIPGMI